MPCKTFFSRYPITKCHVSVKSPIWDPRIHLGRFISHLMPHKSECCRLESFCTEAPCSMCIGQRTFITQAWTPDVLLLFQTVQREVFEITWQCYKKPSQNFRYLFRNYSNTVILLNQAHRSCIDISKNQDVRVAPLSLLDAFRTLIGWSFYSVSIKWWAW